MAERAGKDVVVQISGASTAFTKQSATAQAGNLIYIMDTAANRVFDPDGTFLVYDSDVLTVEPYTIDYIQGAVVFTTNATRTITVSGARLTMSTVATASAVSVNETCDLADVTPFGSTHKKRIAGLLSASGTLTEFDVTDTVFNDAIIAADFLILDIYEVSTAQPKRYWAVFESSELQAAVEGAQTQVLSWQSHKEFNRLTTP